MKELLEALADAPNVKSIKYSKKRGQWLIKYKSDLAGTYCQTSDLLDSIKNV